MTHDDAVKVAAVLANVDGGCHVCASSAAEDLQGRFPEIDWQALVMVEHFGMDPNPFFRKPVNY